MRTKFCPDCRRDLPATEFTHDVRRDDGLAFYCRSCANQRQALSRRQRNGPPRARRNTSVLVPEGQKWCPECEAVKPIEDFPRNRSAKTGYGSYCKPCNNVISRRNREAHGGARNYHLRRRYGITAEHAERMLAEQGGVCAICREAAAEHVDHDHATGRVRGLLCFHCNGALGQFRDRPDLMLLAVHYLERGAGAAAGRPDGAVVGFAVGFDDVSPRPPDVPPDLPGWEVA